jgi:drug/metabolite transporter (DMT)-like permease
MLVVCLQKKRLPSGTQLIALLLAMAGVFLSATHGNVGTLSISPAALFWGLISAVTLVIYTMYPQRIIAEFGALHITGPSMLFGGSVMVFFAPWRGVPAIDGMGWAALISMAVIGTAVAYTMYLQGVAMLGAVKGSLCSCIEPVSATVMAALLMESQFGLWDVIGALCIVSTVFVLSLHNNKES